MTLKQSLPVLFAIGFGLLAGVGAAQAQETKVGVFDPQRITQETAEGARIQARLSALKDKKTGELKKLSEELEKMQQSFVQAATSASDEKKKEMQQQLERKQIELEGAQKSAQREMQVEVEQAQEGWQKRVIEVIRNYAKEKKLSLVVAADVAVFYSSDVDITGDLIKAIDASVPASEAPAPAAPAKPAPKK
ncbi:MAG: OmpH family outer membrane protein [Candidatus Polarisedimenticolia bacterium]|nr:OmpH family outer membrane protein [bacterium]